MGQQGPREETVWLQLGSSVRGKNGFSRLGIMSNLSIVLSGVGGEFPEGQAGTYECMS